MGFLKTEFGREWVMVDERIPATVPLISVCNLQHGKIFAKKGLPE